MHGQPVRAGQTRRPCPDDRHALAGPGRTFEGLLALGHRVIGGKALQAANLDRLAFGSFADTGLFAQGLGRADPGAHAAKDVLRPDRLGRSIRGTGRDLADEQGNVDVGRASRDAGRIVAEIAPIRRDTRLVGIKRRFVIAEILGIGCGWQAARNNAGRQRAVLHRTHILPVCLFVRLAQVCFFIKR